METQKEKRIACFKAYDVRGRVPDELDEDLVLRIGRGYVAEVRPKGAIAVGRDIRLSSDALSQALIRGLTEGGADVVDIGLCGTEMVYFAASLEGMGGGIMVTASHNPRDYNGMKFVREGARPISSDSGLLEIEARVRTGRLGRVRRKGTCRARDILPGYIERLLSFVDRRALRPLSIVTNAGNGCAGPIIDALAPSLPFRFVRIHHEPDGNFPNGIPNPLLSENRPPTIDAVLEAKADLGVAWDGDFDRCFLFDEKGGFVEGYYIVGLLAERMLKKTPGAKVIHDPRLIWNTIDIARAHGGIPVQNKTGHAFMKERMRAEDAIYGGEMSAHHYFREFTYCDSGMIPWLLVASAVSESGRPLSDLIAERERLFPCSGEINRRLDDPKAAIERVRAHFAPEKPAIDLTDGLSMAFGDRWRLNLRESNTEPVLRLNVEARGDRDLMRAKTDESLALIGGEP